MLGVAKIELDVGQNADERGYELVVEVIGAGTEESLWSPWVLLPQSLKAESVPV